jgi:four helix bundle protein
VAQSFRELKVWGKAVDLTVMVYELTSEFPKQEVYGLSSQMRRASVSIASNLAEGSARGTNRNFRQFVKLARGSICELQTQFEIARRLKFGDVKRCDQAEALSHEVGKMLSGLSLFTDRIKRKSAEN